jgi:hypothetical protein
MDSGMIIVLVVVFVLVVGVNGFLILFLRRESSRSGSSWFGLYRKFARRARNPWERENEDLEELSTLVEKLKDKDK